MEFHWHNHMQFYFFKSGNAEIHLANKTIPVSANNIILINSSELHYLKNTCSNLEVYIIRIDFSALNTNENAICQLKYILPLTQNVVEFVNQIDDPVILGCLKNIIAENEQRNESYELAFRGNAYLLLSLLYRKYCKRSLSIKEATDKIQKLKRFQCIFEFIETHYNEQITLEQL
jgi:hypothetical protein